MYLQKFICTITVFKRNKYSVYVILSFLYICNITETTRLCSAKHQCLLYTGTFCDLTQFVLSFLSYLRSNLLIKVSVKQNQVPCGLQDTKKSQHILEPSRHCLTCSQCFFPGAKTGELISILTTKKHIHKNYNISTV